MPPRPMRPTGLTDAVLEALPYTVAVLDRAGTIVAVNTTWRRMARENGAPDLAEGSIGLNYLAVSRDSTGPDSAQAEAAAAGIQAVLEGLLPEFGLEYPCHSPTEQRWFLLRVTPLPGAPGASGGGGAPGGAVVAHLDITERKLAEEERAHLLAREQAARAEAESVTRQLQQLAAVTDATLAHLSLAELLPDLSDRIRQVMAVDNVSVLLLTEDGQELTVRSARGVLANLHVRFPLGRSVAGRIAASRQPLIVEDLSTVEIANPELREKLHALAGVPLLIEGRLIGVLLVGTVTPRHFTQADVQLLQLVADRLALAIDRARLFEDAQAARQAAEAWAGELDATLEAMTDGMVVFDPEGNVVHANRAYRDMLATVGATGTETTPLRERTAHLTVRDVHGQPPPSAHWPIPRLLRGEVLQDPTTLDMRLVSPDGQEWEFNFSGAPVRDEQGRITGAVAVLRDVTARRRLERRTQEALQGVLAMAQALTSPDSAAAGVAASGATPGTGEVSRRLAEAARSVLGAERILLMGVDPETERVRPLVRVGRPLEDEQQWYAEAGQFGLSDYPSPGLIPRLRAGEVVVYDLTEAARQGLPIHGVSRLLVAPLRLGADLVGLLGVDFGVALHGFTTGEYALAGATADLAALVLQRDQLYQEREAGRVRELTLQETTQRMDEFLATASHDLRAPLTVTMGSIDLATGRFERLAAAVLARTPDLADQVAAARRCLNETSQSVDRLARLVALLFDTSLVHAGKLELHCLPCDLAAVVRESLEALRLAHPQRTIDLQVLAAGPGPGPGPVPVVADADRLGQVVTNYLINALKYSPEDQAVAVRVDVPGAGAARVAVADHGPGLPRREQDRIWQKFYRAEGVRVQSGSGSGLGLGLGLHICKTIVEAHGGQVGVESAVGQGSTFWFTLPLTHATG
jgi:signal transduction histidine kinase/putative methionine-R-sulfoxide reductase with GAF domain